MLSQPSLLSCARCFLASFVLLELVALLSICSKNERLNLIAKIRSWFLLLAQSDLFACKFFIFVEENGIGSTCTSSKDNWFLSRTFDLGYSLELQWTYYARPHSQQFYCWMLGKLQWNLHQNWLECVFLPLAILHVHVSKALFEYPPF